jgi:F-type H+-transporting ATPase subunit b
MDALIGTFHIDWKAMIAQMINFAVVFFVLYRFALRPLMKMLDERNHTIQNGLDNAQKYQALLEEAEGIHEKELAKARIESHQLLSEMKQQSEEKRIEMLMQAEQDVKKMLDENRKTIEEEKNKMIDSLKKEVGDLVIKATERVVGSTVKDKVSEEVVRNSLSDVIKHT